MRDAYDKLFQKYRKEDFFRDSLEEIIFVSSTDKLDINWKTQKEKLLNNGELFIRSYGRNGSNTNVFKILYKHLFSNINIKIDATNNAKPTQILTQLTGLCKVVKSDRTDKERIQNYQVSHLFGKTKNPLLFTAAWNIAYIPKYIDPFTGHETQGNHRNEFQKMFEDKKRRLFKDYISDYNLFISEKVNPYLEDALALTKQETGPGIQFAKFEQDIKTELSEI